METLRRCILRQRKEFIIQSPGRIEIYRHVDVKRKPIYRIGYRRFIDLVGSLDRIAGDILCRNVVDCIWKRRRCFFHNHRFVSPLYVCRIHIGQVIRKESSDVFQIWKRYVDNQKGECAPK